MASGSNALAAIQRIVGRSLTLDRRPFRIVGVMPDGFAVPDRRRSALDPVGHFGRSASRPALSRRNRTIEAGRLHRPGRRAAERRRAGRWASNIRRPTAAGECDLIAARRDRRRHGDCAVGAAWPPLASFCWWHAPTSRCCPSCGGWIDRMTRRSAWRLARRPAACSASS